MKIKFLGTSAGWPLPRLGCKCEICTSTDPKDRRTRTQILVNESVLLDAGPDTYHHLLSLTSHPETFAPLEGKLREGSRDSSPSAQNDNIAGVCKIQAILVSHAHLDHIEGFWDLTHIYNGYKPIPVYIVQSVLNDVRKFIGIHGQNLKIHVVKPHQSFAIGHAKVEYFPVIHGRTPAFGIKVKDGPILAYIPDFNKILPSSQKVIRDCHLLIIDGSSLDKIGQTKGHISINDGIQIAKNLRAKSTYFVHIGHKTGTHQFLEDYLHQNAGQSFHIAYDGLEIDI